MFGLKKLQYTVLLVPFVFTIKSTKSNHDDYSIISNAQPSEYSYPHFPEIIQPRLDKVPVRNKYHIDLPLCDKTRLRLHRDCGDYHVVISYVSVNSGSLSLRRLDDTSWNYSFILQIFDVSTSDYDKFIIPTSSNVSWLYLHFSTTINLVPDLSIFKNQSIPKSILQTYYTRDALNTYHWNAFFTFVDLNPEYEISIMLDQECREFIRTHFSSDILLAYDSLVPSAFQADLFRYCHLYIMGGCYFDNKLINRQPLRSIIHENDDFIVCSDTNPGGVMADSLSKTKKLYNAIICSQPKDFRLWKTIQHVIKNIKSKGNRLYHSGDLSLTGPLAFYNSVKNDISDHHVRLKHGYSYESFTDKYWSHHSREYTEYYVINKITNGLAFNKAFKGYYSHRRSDQHGGYSSLWTEGRVFYEKPISYQNNTYLIFLESKLTKSYKYSMKNSTIQIKSKLSSLEMKNILNGVNNLIGQHKKSYVITPMIRIKSNFQSNSLLNISMDCSKGIWFPLESKLQKSSKFSETKESMLTKRKKKKSNVTSSSGSSGNSSSSTVFSNDKKEVHTARLTTIKIVEMISSREILLSFELPSSSDIILKIVFCL